MKLQERTLLGELLVECKAITPAQLSFCLVLTATSGNSIGWCLIESGMITELQLGSALQAQYTIRRGSSDYSLAMTVLEVAMSERIGFAELLRQMLPGCSVKPCVTQRQPLKGSWNTAERVA